MEDRVDRVLASLPSLPPELLNCSAITTLLEREVAQQVRDRARAPLFFGLTAPAKKVEVNQTFLSKTLVGTEAHNRRVCRVSPSLRAVTLVQIEDGEATRRRLLRGIAADRERRPPSSRGDDRKERKDERRRVDREEGEEVGRRKDEKRTDRPSTTSGSRLRSEGYEEEEDDEYPPSRRERRSEGESRKRSSRDSDRRERERSGGDHRGDTSEAADPRKERAYWAAKKAAAVAEQMKALQALRGGLPDEDAED